MRKADQTEVQCKQGDKDMASTTVRSTFQRIPVAMNGVDTPKLLAATQAN
jgi:hypothetical protein